MAAISEAVLRETADLIRASGGMSAAARASGLSRQTIQSRYRRLQQLGPTLGIEVPPINPIGVYTDVATRGISRADRRAIPQTADAHWQVLDEAIGRRARPVVVPHARTDSGFERIVVAGDFHAPFHEPDLVARLVEAERGSDVLIINGDLQDFYSISRFTKYERVSIEDELAAVDALLGKCSEAFGEVVLVCGNHDRPRFERQLRNLLTPELVEVVLFLTGGHLDPIAMLAKRYPNVRIASHPVGRHAVGWFYQRGDLICAHAEKFSRVPGSALRTIHEWLAERTHALGLQPWRVLVQAHTHQLGLLPWMADSMLIEGGCMCQTHGYQLDAKIAGRPQRRGYVTLDQVDGRTNPNSVRLYWWDQAIDR